MYGPNIMKTRKSPLELSCGRSLLLDARGVAIKSWWQSLPAGGQAVNEMEGNGDSEQAI